MDKHQIIFYPLFILFFSSQKLIEILKLLIIPANRCNTIHKAYVMITQRHQ